MNYYYFGYVLVGTPVKLLGILPAIAFNLCIPTLFAMTGIGAFGVAYNVVASRLNTARDDGDSDPQASFAARRKWALRAPNGSPYIAGVAAIVLCLLIGNLDTPREVFTSFASAGGYTSSGNVGPGDFSNYLAGIIHGIGQTAQSGLLQIGADRWYWGPTRILGELPGNSGEIVEMPAFTYILRTCTRICWICHSRCWRWLDHGGDSGCRGNPPPSVDRDRRDAARRADRWPDICHQYLGLVYVHADRDRRPDPGHLPAT